VRVLLAGLWTRRGMNVASLLVAVIAIGAAVLGPMYGRESAEHLLDTRLDERAPYTVGLTYSVPAQAGTDVLADPDDYVAPPVDDLVASSTAMFRDPDVRRFWSPATSWALDRGGSFTYSGRQYAAPTYWRDGMCELATVQGRCPSRAGEVLMQQTMARTLGLDTGDRFPVRYLDSYLLQGNQQLSGTTAERPRTVDFEVVGTYTIDRPASPAWFDLSRFTGLNDLIVPPQRGSGAAPTAPALLVASASMTSQSFEAGVDRPLDTGVVDLATIDRVESEARSFKNRAVNAANQTDVLADLDLASVFDQVRSERTLLSRVMVAALTPLILLTLLLLFALVSSAAQVRRPHVALAKLRGQTRGQVLWFALAEPFLVVLVAVPLGGGLAIGVAHAIARGWLHDGIPVSMDAVTVVSLVVVVGAALAASTVAALAVIREPLAAALNASVRPRPTSRLALVMRSAVVAVAVAAVANLLVSGDQSNQLLALLTPTFVALAVAVGGAVLLRFLGQLWVRRTADAGGLASFLASRRLGRRQDVANLMIPLLLAAAVLTFASTTIATSDAWREARAAADIGAARTFVTSVSPGRLLQVTREVDPDGRYVAASVVNTEGDDMSRGVFVDVSRLATVAAWDPAWSDSSLRSLQAKLAPRPAADRLALTGKRLTVTVDDVRLSSDTGVRSQLHLQYVDDDGEQADVLVGDLRNRGRQQLTTTLERCARSCPVEQLYITGDNVSVSDVQGSLTLESVAVDGRQADWHLDPAAWRPARPFPVSLVDPPVVLEKAPNGLRLKLFLGQLPAGEGPQNAQVSGFARITPTTTPDVVPALVARGTRTEPAARTGSGIALDYPPGVVAGVSLNGQQVPMRVVDEVAALPMVGTEGSLSDLETALVEFEPPPGALVTTVLLVGDGTPASVLSRIRQQGVDLADERVLATTLRDLRGDAFSLGLRVFLIVGLATLLIAVFGVFASAVLQSRWRSYEVASLRVVGVSRRALVRGSVLEYVSLLGFAVLLGVLSAYLSLLLVLPSISLGTAGEFDPAPVYDTPWLLVLTVAAVLLALATLIAVLVSRRTTRMGRPSTLRWAEQA
jgi:putative ABC transport system permease protein